VCLCASVAASDANNGVFTTTYSSYNPNTGNFDLTMSIKYEVPDPTLFGPGPYPVFTWTTGTVAQYDNPVAMLVIQNMASRGFLAATVDYSQVPLSSGTIDCQDIYNRGQGVFDATRATSAVGVLCALPNASCGTGVVTSGMSQGGFLAVLAANYAPTVKATYALSVSDYIKTNGVDLSACLDKQHTMIPANRLTIVDGASDNVLGGQQPVENVSGFTCPDGSTQCWSPDNSGAGWYFVQDSQVQDGRADHCYFQRMTCGGPLDPGWPPPANSNWSLGPNLDWLSTFGTHRVFGSQ
jgi:hypothetical protein